MLSVAKNLYAYRHLLVTLCWKSIAVRYKQTYIGIGWVILKPIVLMLTFTLIRSFVGIDSGDVPYPILTFAALLPWSFFQEATSDGVNSVVANSHLIKKIYFPREIFPLTSVLTKLVDLSINLVILAALMVWYRMMPTIHILWFPVIIAYAVMVTLTLSLCGAALNVFFRDVAQLMPVLFSLLMFASPVIYPLQLVKDKLLVQRAAGDWSDALFTLYTLNPLAGIIDAFQSAVLRGTQPDLYAMLPGALMIVTIFPFVYVFFKRAESHFADII